MHEVWQIIEQAWEGRANLSPGAVPARIGDVVAHVLGELDGGARRVDARTRAKTGINELLRD